MPDGAEDSPPSASASTPPRGRMLLPFYIANLAVIYVPSLLPLALEAYRKLDEEIGIDRKSVAIDALAAPWAGLKFVLPRDVYSLSPWLGNAGSLYLFLLTLWFAVLLISALYANDKHRYRLTFVLFVLSTVQAIFVAERFVRESQEQQQQRQQVPGQVGRPGAAGAN